MNYSQAKKFIESSNVKFSDFNPVKTRELLKLANIELDSIIIHIAGSNGKGSTSAMIESVLTEQGYKVGFYSSPHLIDLTERIRVNKKNVSKKEFTKNLSELIPIIEKSELNPSYFEILTVLAAKIFSKKKLDFIILETGLGGRLDATNAFKTQVQVITSISKEHEKHLGNTIKKISREKAGIIKPKSIVIIRKDNLGYKIVKEKIVEKKAIELNPKKEFEKIKTNLIGVHQKQNLSLAITVIQAIKKLGFKVSEESIRKGLKKVNWLARMQVIQKKPLIILDSAHNPNGVENLFNSLKEFKYNNLIIVFGVLKDKNYEKMISLIHANYLILTKPVSKRALNPKKLIPLIKKNKNILEFKIIENVLKAFKKAKQVSEKNDLILIFGSLYLSGEILKTINNNEKH